MKSKYVFIRNWPCINAGDFIYHVWVGSSRREQAKMLLVREFCKDCGLYFKLMAPQVDVDLEEIRNRFRKPTNVLANPFRSASVTISQLYQMIVEDSLGAFEENQVESPSSLWWNFHNDPNYIKSINQRKVLQHASPSERKNLSPRKRVAKHEVDIFLKTSNA